jgi:predicted nucleic acid-binding protein
MVYADTSVLASLYMLDANTPQAISLLRSIAQPLVYSALHRLELHNALAPASFRGHQTQAQSDAAWRNVQVDLQARILFPVQIRWHAAFRRAASLARLETPSSGNRSLDILHIACAEQLGATTFLTFDRRQQNLCTRVGLAVRP